MKYLPAASACTRQPNWIKSQRHKTLGWLRAHAQGGSHSLTRTHAPRKSGSAMQNAEKTSLISTASNFSCSLYTRGRRHAPGCICLLLCAANACLAFFSKIKHSGSSLLGSVRAAVSPTHPPCSRIRPSSPLLTCLESEMASFQPLILLSCSLILSPNVFHPPNGPPAAAILYPKLSSFPCMRSLYIEAYLVVGATRLNAVRAFCGSINIIIRASKV
jgi:hypothetical protein